MSAVQTLLASDGIVELASPLPAELHARINLVADGLFAERSDKARSYVACDELASLGLLEPILQALRDTFLTIMPDPTLYHCHIYETAGGSKQAHIYGETLAGWHRDPDSEYAQDRATHVSIFIHMTDVGPEDGAFEFCPGSPEKWLTSSTPIVSVTGPKNFSYAWNRTFLHRASPNRGPRRRRMLKISIQPIGSHNQRHDHSSFVATREIVRAGDPFLDMLVGRDPARPCHMVPAGQIEGRPLVPTGTLSVPNVVIMQTLARQKLAAARRRLRRGASNETALQYE